MAPQCEPLCHFSDRLYFTTFPQPAPLPHVLNRPSDAEGRPDPPPVRAKSNIAGPPATPDCDATYYYFTIDHQLLYLSFFKDWGPLNLAMVYKACILIHELLEDEELKSHRLILYASDDPRRKANAALLMALYVMIVQKKAPWEAFQPIAELEFMPFRDAGRGHSDFNLTLQDCLWGIWKAMQNGLCDMNEFSVEDYEYYEKVENGDWNWLTPAFIAFASPVEPTWTKRTVGGTDDNGSCASPVRRDSALQRKLPTPFVNCLDYFEARGVKLVVRLNNMLYDKQHFLDRGIRHEELYFDDGTNPTDEIVRKFINLADEVVEAGGSIAVHCKAGLGRTGTLIGAYLIWKYGFTAHEAIAFMRIVRPGSVVGPQQQYMYVKQLEWTKWAAVDEMRRAEAQAAAAIAAASVITPATPPAEVDDVDDAMESVENVTTVVMPSTPKSKAIPPVTPSKHVSMATARARAISPPGQPRKTPVAKRTAAVAAVDESDEESDEDELNALPILGANNTRARSKTQPSVPTRSTARRVQQPASEQRPARMTRSVAAGGVRRPAPVGGAKGTGGGPSPNKIPRLAPVQEGAPARSATVMGTRARAAGAPPPTPSRLPTLIATKRMQTGTAGMTGTAAIGTRAAEKAKKAGASSSDAWMTTNPSAVVVPGTKSERPGLRSIRRRRSSFSAAEEVIA